MFRLFRSRPLGRMVTTVMLLCAMLALQPANHAHAQPSAAAHHAGHDGHDHGSGAPADQGHEPAALSDSCCHVAISGCSAVAFLPANATAEVVVWRRGPTMRLIDASDLAGRTTPPEHRPPRLSS